MTYGQFIVLDDDGPNNYIQNNSLTLQYTCVLSRTGNMRTTPSQSLASSATNIETEISP